MFAAVGWVGADGATVETAVLGSGALGVEAEDKDIGGVGASGDVHNRGQCYKLRRWPNKQMCEAIEDCGTAWIKNRLYHSYSSSQSYFYTSKIMQIVRAKRTPAALLYEDLETYCEDDEFLRRHYRPQEYEHKMAAFKQYYFYHEDCPRIFSSGIEDIYERWHEKRRDVIYKKLKQMFNESYSSAVSSEEEPAQDLPPVSHFLLEISDYNPYSKKYYLRVQARQQKEEQDRVKARLQKTNTHLSGLNHDLSQMIGGLGDISEIAFVETCPSPVLRTPIEPRPSFKKPKQVKIREHDLTEEPRKGSLEPAIISQLKIVSKDAYAGQSKLLLGEKFRTRSIISISSMNSKVPTVSLADKKSSLKVPKLNFRPSKMDLQLNQPTISKGKSLSKLKPSPAKVQPRQLSLKKLAPPLSSRVDEFTDRKLTEPTNLLSYKSAEGRAGRSSSLYRLSQPQRVKIKLFNQQ